MLYPCKVGSTGKGNVIDLGTGNTFDVSEYAGYSSFTIDNFIVSVDSVRVSGGASVGTGYANSGSTTATVTPTITKNYDSSTGKLTVSASNTSASNRVNVSSSGTQWLTASTSAGNFVFHAYLIRG